MVNLSAPFFCTTLVAAGLKLRSSNYWNVFSLNSTLVYSVGLLLLFGAFIYLIGRKKGRGFVQFSIFYLVMVLVGKIFFDNIVNLESRFRGHSAQEAPLDMDEVSTNIGNIEELKLSKKVHWRMWVPDGQKPPELIPFAVYDVYGNGIWRNSFGRKKSQHQNSYSTGVVLTDQNIGNIQVFGGAKNRDIKINKNNAYRFLGSLNVNTSKAAMPHIPGYFCYGGLVGRDAQVQHSPLGGVEVVNPDATLHCMIWRHPDEAFSLSEVSRGVDKSVSKNELRAVDSIIAEAGLEGLSEVEVVEKLRLFFTSQFKYSTNLTIVAGKTTSNYKNTALTQFLLDVRKGHCEYFATATTLILRRLGMNALYVNGYALSHDEKRDDAYLLRGDQAHAWSRVWIDGKWERVDLTPPDWRKFDLAGGPGIGDRISDWWKMVKEDFQLWRSSEENAQLTNYIIVGIFGLMVVWILIRLWFAKNKQKNKVLTQSSLPPWKMMKRFDKWCVRRIGPRPLGTPYGSWMRLLLDKFPEKESDVEEFVERYQRARFLEDSPEQVASLKQSIGKLMRK